MLPQVQNAAYKTLAWHPVHQINLSFYPQIAHDIWPGVSQPSRALNLLQVYCIHYLHPPTETSIPPLNPPSVEVLFWQMAPCGVVFSLFTPFVCSGLSCSWDILLYVHISCLDFFFLIKKTFKNNFFLGNKMKSRKKRVWLLRRSWMLL